MYACPEIARNDAPCRGLVHAGPSQCLMEFFVKLLDVGKVASKYYVMFHVIPLILRVKKAKDPRKVPGLAVGTFYEYTKSCCFISFLVGLLRAGLCANWNQSPDRILSFCTHAATQTTTSWSQGRYRQ